MIVRLLLQTISTLLTAFTLYSIITQFYTSQQTVIENEYFPFGWRLLQEQQESNRHRLKVAADYLQKVNVENFKVGDNVVLFEEQRKRYSKIFRQKTLPGDFLQGKISHFRTFSFLQSYSFSL